MRSRHFQGLYAAKFQQLDSTLGFGAPKICGRESIGPRVAGQLSDELGAEVSTKSCDCILTLTAVFEVIPLLHKTAIIYCCPISA